jgi:uncharacterized membrane protein YidH (DUF202 family)
MTEVEVAQDRWLAGQRTELAWSRSGLSVLAVVVLLVRRLTELFTTGGSQMRMLALLVTVVAIGGLFALVWRRRHQQARPARLRLISLGTAALALVALSLALFPPD